MPYRIDPSRPTSEEARRIAGEQLSRAIVALQESETSDDPDASIHSARKRLKRVRSLLRLLRVRLDPKVYKRDLSACRDVAKLMSAFRDADVTARTVRSIVAEAADPPVAEYVDPIALELESRRDASWGDRGSARPIVAESLASLGDLSRRVDAWSLTGLEWPDLANGIDRTYRRGRRAWRQVELAGEDVQPEMFHEVRKRTKDLRYQLELLRDAWPPVLSGSAEGAAQLADLLGEMQDLNVTRTTLLSGRGVDWNPDGADSLLGEIDRQTTSRRVDAARLGPMVYAERPKAFDARMQRYVAR